MKIKCLITDDEPLAIKILENYITRIDDLEVVATARNGLEAYQILQKESIDLLFLDIQMPQLNGLELVRNLQHPPKIIFTTAHRDFAVESYELYALDYLLKPIAFDRFLKAIEKFEKNSKMDENPGINLENEFLFLKSDKKIFKVALKNILYIESLKDYIIVHTTTDKIQTYQNISHIEQLLPKEKFLRIHRSFIVALEHIHSFNATQINIANIDLPIGRTYKEQVSEALGLDRLFAN